METESDVKSFLSRYWWKSREKSGFLKCVECVSRSAPMTEKRRAPLSSKGGGLVGKVGPRKQTLYHTLGVVFTPKASGLGQQMDFVNKIFSVGANHNRPTIGGDFQYIVPPMFHQRAADEGANTNWIGGFQQPKLVHNHTPDWMSGDLANPFRIKYAVTGLKTLL